MKLFILMLLLLIYKEEFFRERVRFRREVLVGFRFGWILSSLFNFLVGMIEYFYLVMSIYRMC